MGLADFVNMNLLTEEEEAERQKILDPNCDVFVIRKAYSAAIHEICNIRASIDESLTDLEEVALATCEMCRDDGSPEWVDLGNYRALLHSNRETCDAGGVVGVMLRLRAVLLQEKEIGK